MLMNGEVLRIGGKVVKRIDQAESFRSFALSPEGDLVAAASPFALWDWQHGVRLRLLPVKNSSFGRG